LEGQLIVAQSVLDELQTLADSSSNEKRSKGRRGLKLLKELRDSYGRRLVINPTKYEGNGVDEKLLKITEDMAGTLITADYNLSQIAEVKELKVVECAKDGKDNNYELCQTKGISGFPSWEINGEIISGTRDLNELAIKTGYQGDSNF